MPIYEYRCRQCHKKVTVFFRSFQAVQEPVCDRCGSPRLTRLISPVAVMKPWGESTDIPGMESLSDVDESDPKAMAAWMRRIKRELGDEAGELSDLDLLDAGIRPGEPESPGEEEGEGEEEESL